MGNEKRNQLPNLVMDGVREISWKPDRTGAMDKKP